MRATAVTAVLVADALLWRLFRYAGTSADGTIQALLLLDTLLVVGWYALLTYRLASTGQQQLNLAKRSFEAANRPCVVIEWVPASATFVAKNIGPGLAVVAVWIDDPTVAEPNVLHLGAIESGGAIDLPDRLVGQLDTDRRDPLQRKRHTVIAEPLIGELWTVSRNLMESSGRLSHQVGTMRITQQQRQQIHHETIEEGIHRNWPAIQKDLDTMLKALEGDKPKDT